MLPQVHALYTLFSFLRMTPSLAAQQTLSSLSGLISPATSSVNLCGLSKANPGFLSPRDSSIPLPLQKPPWSLFISLLDCSFLESEDCLLFIIASLVPHMRSSTNSFWGTKWMRATEVGIQGPCHWSSSRCDIWYVSFWENQPHHNLYVRRVNVIVSINIKCG